jgi:hypothetical protein
MGTFTYAQNIYHAWTQVHVDVDKIRVVSRGVDPDSGSVVELYGITIENHQL